ncbi:MAG: YcaO-like family protein [Oligoflexia bacterium]|nr:YcaO-like family protein [Oligoflexia bacterium]
METKANSALFLKWLAVHINQLDIHVNELNWISNFFEGYYDVEVFFKINGNKVFGRGISNKSKDHAVEKAITESIERSVFSEVRKLSDITTSGWAFHIDEQKAILNASLELIERDLFFCHYLTKTPFLDVSDDRDIVKGTLFEIAKRKMAMDGLELKLGHVFSSDDFHCFICIGFGDKYSTPFGSVMGMACDLSIQDAINKAILECVPNLLAHIKGTVNKVYNESDFIKLKKFSPLDHLALSKGLENINYMRSLFSTIKSHLTCKEQTSFFLENMVIEEVSMPGIFKGCGLLGVKAINHDLQKMFFGKTTIDKVNLKRLEKFSGKKLNFCNLQTYPHPFP